MAKHNQLNFPKKSWLDLALFLNFFSVLVALALGQLWRMPLLNGIGAIYPHDFFIGLFFILELLQYLTHKPQTTNHKPKIMDHKLELAFVFWLVLSLSFKLATQQDYLPLIYDLRIIYYAGFSYLTYNQLKTWQKTKFGFRWPWFLSLVGFLGLFGLVQYRFFYDLRVLLYLGWDEHLGRLTSTLLDPNFAGFILAVGLIYWLIIKKRIRNHQWFWWLGSLIYLISLGLTFSRASYLVAFLGLILINLLTKNKQLKLASITLAVMLALTILVIPKPPGEGGRLLRTASIKARVINDLNNLCQTLPQLITSQEQLCHNSNLKLKTQSSKLTNITDPYQKQKDSNSISHALWPNNLFLLIYNQAGLVGLILSLALMLKWGKKLFHKNRTVFVLLAMLLVHAQFNNTAFEPFIFLIFWGTVAEILRLKLDI